jgi:hypothetical protein
MQATTPVYRTSSRQGQREKSDLPKPIGDQKLYVCMVLPTAPFEDAQIAGNSFQKELRHPDESLMVNSGKRFSVNYPKMFLAKNQADYFMQRAKQHTKRIPARLQRQFGCGKEVCVADYLIIEPWDEFDLKGLPERSSTVPIDEEKKKYDQKTEQEKFSNELLDQQAERATKEKKGKNK